MASSRSDSTSQEVGHPKRSILRRSCASSEAPQHRVEDQESASDDLIRNERARRLAQEMDSPVEAVLAALKRQKVYEGPSDHGIIETMDLSVPSHLPHCMDRIDQEIPGYLLLHHHQVRDYLQYRHQRTLRHGAAEALKILVRVRPALTPLISSNVSIANWINSAIRIQRPHRSRQMWIKAPLALGRPP